MIFARNFWLLIKPAEDVPGQWVGHCLDLDIVSVGSSLQDAIRMTSEAVCECIADDFAHGLSPLQRRGAPPEYYTELQNVQNLGRVCTVAELPKDQPVTAVLQLGVHMHMERVEARRPTAALEDCLQALPPAWAMDKYNSEHRSGAHC